MNSSVGVMSGKRGLVMGVANERSIAWGIAKMAATHGAELAFTYQGEALLKRLSPLAQSVNSEMVMQCDVTDEHSLETVFNTCLLYTSPSPRDSRVSRMPSSA